MKKNIQYYDSFSKVYDIVSSDLYYRKARSFAIEKMRINTNDIILNVPCGTGQNFRYFQEKLKGKSLIVGVDLSAGMLKVAQRKVKRNNWENISLIKENALKINQEWLNNQLPLNVQVSKILCDLGLSGFPDWKLVIDQLWDLLSKGGKLVIMDWYLPKRSIRGSLVKWIGKGEVGRPMYQYLQGKTHIFQLDTSFNRGGVFVAVATKE